MNVAFMTPLKYSICSIIFPLAKRNKLPKGTKTSNQNQPCPTSVCTRACVFAMPKDMCKKRLGGADMKEKPYEGFSALCTRLHNHLL